MRNLSRFINFFLFTATLTLTSVNVFADVKIKSRQTMQGQTTENTIYIKGKRQRTEMAGGTMTTILQCDLRRDLQIMPQAQAYLVNVFDDGSSSEPVKADLQHSKSEPVSKGGTVTTIVTNKDTGERRQMFGYPARHIITTMETSSSPDACLQTKSKIETDGWYIDAAFALDCDMWRAQSYINRKKSGCQDKSVYKTVGTAKIGYPVLTKMTMFDENGKESYSITNEVIELSNATLDASLFDVPAGYREVKNPAEMFKSSASSSMNGSRTSGMSMSSSSMESKSNNSALNQNVKVLAGKTSGESASVGAKRAGVIRLGIATIKTGSVGEGMNAVELAAAIQNTLAGYLKTPNLELVNLETKLPSAIDAEAKEKECDYVVYTNVSHKKGGGGGFGFGKILGQAVAQTGIGHTGSAAGNIAGQIAANAIVSAGEMSGSVKAKDEITLDYKLVAVGSANPALANTLKAKAKSNGEDIISPLFKQVAEAIVATVSKK